MGNYLTESQMSSIVRVRKEGITDSNVTDTVC